MTTSSTRSSRTPAPALRELRTADREPIGALLRATAAFTDEEVRVALELVDDGLAGGASRADAYRFVVAELDEAGAVRVVGYVCYGLAPLSDGVFDVYWIAVDPDLQGRGTGRALLRAVETEVCRLGGRTILVETGGKSSYAPTRAFYERAGFVEIARIPDYFRVGDDKVIYTCAIDGATLSDPR
jgi:ribosomal protein S18 acetylase RimI-like enzyme